MWSRGGPDVPEGGAADAATPRRQWLRWVAASLVVLLLVGSAAAYRLDLGTRWLDLGRPSPVTQPAQVLPPAGIALPAAHRAPAVADPAVAGPADPAAVRRAVDRLLRSKKLGRHTVAEVAE